MKVVRGKLKAVPTHTLADIGYGGVCHLEGEGDIPFMYIKTSQPTVWIKIQEAHTTRLRGKQHKLLNLETGNIRCVPVGTKVFPANVTLYIEGEKK